MPSKTRQALAVKPTCKNTCNQLYILFVKGVAWLDQNGQMPFVKGGCLFKCLLSKLCRPVPFVKALQVILLRLPFVKALQSRLVSYVFCQDIAGF